MIREVLKVLGVVVAVCVSAALLLASCPVSAQSQEEVCYVYADMAMVARSMALEDIDPDKLAQIMVRIYSGPAMTDNVTEIMVKIEKAAYRSQVNPGQFATHVLAACKASIGTPI